MLNSTRFEYARKFFIAKLATAIVGLLGWIEMVKYMYIKRSLEGEINCK
jgi:hypothetical protein